MRSKKIQALIIKELLKNGVVSILLPDSMKLEIGITQVDKHGDLVKTDEYCYITGTREDRSTIIDKFNLGLSYARDSDTMILEDEITRENGDVITNLDVV